MKFSGAGQGAILLDAAQAGIDEILAGLGFQRTFGATITGTAGAGNAAIAEILNPSASGKILYFLLGDLYVATAMSVGIFANGTSIAPAGTPVPLYTTGAASVASVGGGNQLAPTGTQFHQTPSLTANIDYVLPSWFWYALSANKNLQFRGLTVNQAFTVNVRWIELSV